MITWPDRITAGDLIIRPWKRADAPALSAAIAASLDELRPFMSWASLEPSTLAQREAWIADTTDSVGILAADDRTALGGSGLMSGVGEGGLEIGYWVHSAHTRRGIATTVAAALTQYGFSFAEIDRVEIHCDEANVASAAVPHRLGFTLVAVETAVITAPGQTGRQMIWRLLRDALASSAVAQHDVQW